LSLGIGRHVSGIADPFNGHIDAFRIAHVQRSDGWIATTWHNLSDPGAFAAAWAGEREGGDPPPLAGAGVVVSASWGEGGPQSREMIGFSRSRSRGHGGVIQAAMGGLKLFGIRAAGACPRAGEARPGGRDRRYGDQAPARAAADHRRPTHRRDQ
jgi:hypothetical protein